MSDELNWDDEEFDAPEIGTLGQQTIAKESGQRFEGEDAEEEKPEVIKQPKPAQKKEPSKYAHKGTDGPIEEPLDDPVAEKERQARRQEEADFKHTLDAFGGGNAKKLEDFNPVSASDFEEYARLVIFKHFTPYRLNTHFKALLKHSIKDMASSLPSNEVKDLENCLAALRVEKQRLEKAEKENAAKKGKKASLKFEKNSVSAGLDDAIYDVDDDDDDFM